MVEAPERVWVQKVPSQFFATDIPISNWPEYLRSDIAERQIAELQAELTEKRRDRIADSEIGGSYLCRLEAAEAENARLRALPLKDEVERVLELAEPHLVAAAVDRIAGADKSLSALQALLSRLRAGEQEGWRDNDTVKRATESAIAFWRTCKRPDLKDEDKVRGALIKYQMALDAAAIASPSVSEGGSRNG